MSKEKLGEGMRDEGLVGFEIQTNGIELKGLRDFNAVERFRLSLAVEKETVPDSKARLRLRVSTVRFAIQSSDFKTTSKFMALSQITNSTRNFYLEP
eukprot:2117413-Rhodomonas_salina.1